MELHEKQKLAKNWIKKKYPHISEQQAEDFSSYYIEVCLTGGDKRDLGWIATDFFRQYGDRLGARGTSDAMGSLARRYETDEETEDPIEQFESQSRRPDEPRLLCYRKLNTKQRLIMVLTYEWGFTLKEIGHCLGVSESRVSQMHNEVLRIQKKILTGEMLSEEKIETLGILQKKIQGDLQKRSEDYYTGKRAMEAISPEKTITKQELGHGTTEKVQTEKILGAFRASTW